MQVLGVAALLIFGFFLAPADVSAQQPGAGTASFRPPADCGPLRRQFHPRERMTVTSCRWQRSAHDSVVVDLEELRRPEPGRPAGWSPSAAELSDYVKKMMVRRLDQERLGELKIGMLDARRNPPGATVCATYAFTAEGRRVPGAIGKAFVLRGRGVVCDAYDPATREGAAVTFTLSQRYAPELGGSPLPDFDAEAAKLIGTLRMR